MRAQSLYVHRAPSVGGIAFFFTSAGLGPATPTSARSAMASQDGISRAIMHDERKALEQGHAAALRDEKVAKNEIKELTQVATEHDELLASLKYRVSAVTSELNQLKLNSAVAQALRDGEKNDTDDNPDLEVVTFREILSTINSSFTSAVNSRLRDDELMHVLSSQNDTAKPEFCRVSWGEGMELESADWKVFDPRDGTDVTFGALLQDVCRYWGLDHDLMTFEDKAGAHHLLDSHVWDELGPTGDVSIRLSRRPNVQLLDTVEYNYEIDETLLPLAERRRLERARRAKQLERKTKADIRKQEARERAALTWELIQYILMMMLYFYVLLWERRSVQNAYLLTDSLRTVFIEENFGDANEKAFMDIRTYEELYSWARDVFTEGLLPSEYYDGTEIPTEQKRVNYYNRIVGGVRMRQTRVTPNARCIIYANVITTFTPTVGPDQGEERLRKYVEQCFAQYTFGEGGSWSRRPFSVMAQNTSNTTGPEECRELHNGVYEDARITDGPDEYDRYQVCLGRAAYKTWDLVDPDTGQTNVTDPLKLAFTWRDEASNDLVGYRYLGRFSSYDGSGFTFDLTNLTTSNLVDAFTYFEENTWLDRQTRILFMSLVVYNGNFNLYAVVNFRFELSLAGVVVPTYTIRTVEMDIFVSWLDSFAKTMSMVLEVVLYCGMLYYLVNEFRELYDVYDSTGSPLGYFSDPWNVIDWSLIILSFFALSMRIQFALLPEVRSFSPFTDQFAELSAAALQYNQSFVFDAIAATFGIFKIFRYYELQHNLFLLRSAVAKGVGDLSFFTATLMLVMFGFALSGQEIFGQENNDFVNPIVSFTTLFLTVLGEFDLDRMLDVDATFALYFFFFYQMFVFLIMINIFLALLNDAYLDVKETDKKREVEEAPPPVTLRERYHQFRAWLRQRELNQRIEILRAEQRKKELTERRSVRKGENARRKALALMGIDPA